jgi:hypothetical protein
MVTVKEFVLKLNEIQASKLREEGYTNDCFFDSDGLVEDWKFKAIYKKKWIYIDRGHSGVYMIDPDGNIFRIKGYGQVNKAKFRGNLKSVQINNLLAEV